MERDKSLTEHNPPSFVAGFFQDPSHLRPTTAVKDGGLLRDIRNELKTGNADLTTAPDGGVQQDIANLNLASLRALRSGLETELKGLTDNADLFKKSGNVRVATGTWVSGPRAQEVVASEAIRINEIVPTLARIDAVLANRGALEDPSLVGDVEAVAAARDGGLNTARGRIERFTTDQQRSRRVSAVSPVEGLGRQIVTLQSRLELAKTLKRGHEIRLAQARLALQKTDRTFNETQTKFANTDFGHWLGKIKESDVEIGTLETQLAAAQQELGRLRGEIEPPTTARDGGLREENNLFVVSGNDKFQVGDLSVEVVSREKDTATLRILKEGVVVKNDLILGKQEGIQDSWDSERGLIFATGNDRNLYSFRITTILRPGSDEASVSNPIRSTIYLKFEAMNPEKVQVARVVSDVPTTTQVATARDGGAAQLASVEVIKPTPITTSAVETAPNITATNIGLISPTQILSPATFDSLQHLLDLASFEFQALPTYDYRQLFPSVDVMNDLGLGPITSFKPFTLPQFRTALQPFKLFATGQFRFDTPLDPAQFRLDLTPGEYKILNSSDGGRRGLMHLQRFQDLAQNILAKVAEAPVQAGTIQVASVATPQFATPNAGGLESPVALPEIKATRYLPEILPLDRNVSLFDHQNTLSVYNAARTDILAVNGARLANDFTLRGFDVAVSQFYQVGKRAPKIYLVATPKDLGRYYSDLKELELLYDSFIEVISPEQYQGMKNLILTQGGHVAEVGFGNEAAPKEGHVLSGIGLFRLGLLKDSGVRKGYTPEAVKALESLVATELYIPSGREHKIQETYDKMV